MHLIVLMHMLCYPQGSPKDSGSQTAPYHQFLTSMGGGLLTTKIQIFNFDLNQWEDWLILHSRQIQHWLLLLSHHLLSPGPSIEPLLQ